MTRLSEPLDLQTIIDLNSIRSITSSDPILIQCSLMIPLVRHLEGRQLRGFCSAAGPNETKPVFGMYGPKPTVDKIVIERVGEMNSNWYLEDQYGPAYLVKNVHPIRQGGAAITAQLDYSHLPPFRLLIVPESAIEGARVR